MTARPAQAAPTGPLDPEAYRKQMQLLEALHHATPVLFKGRQQFMQVLTPRLAGGRIQMDVYLQGRPVPVDSSEISLVDPA